MRERMKRRKKKPQENVSEATGKVGQQKPPVDELHPQPLMPSYGTAGPEAGPDDLIVRPCCHTRKHEHLPEPGERNPSPQMC